MVKILEIVLACFMLVSCGFRGSPSPSQLASDQALQAGNDITIEGRRLILNGAPYVMKAVAWSPVRRGQGFPEGLMFVNAGPDDLLNIEKDLQMMLAMGANTLRTYQPVLDAQVLQLIQRYGFKLIVPVLHSFQVSESQVQRVVETLKDHPTTLLWEVGNEWNYNLLYSEDFGSGRLTLAEARQIVGATARWIRSLDRSHPISSVYGEMPDAATIEQLPEVDIWGANIYSGLSFGSRFTDWLGRSSKPFYIGEYGADAINRGQLDPNSQALAVETLTREIEGHLSARDASKALIGGTVFEWNDEWWKDHAGSNSEQEIGGKAPGGGPYPDFIFNEEWWGLVDINRQPRPAYERLKSLWN